jgi:3-hydroxyisobutyrate dehydrogenase
MDVTVLGTGTMGTGMTHALVRAGHTVTVWNRSPERAEPLSRDGAHVVSSAATAVRDADVVVTMLTDGDATHEVMRTTLRDVPRDAVWAQMGTVGVAATDALAGLAGDAGVAFADAPVSGTKAPAERGELLVLAAAPRDVRPRCQPVFDAVGSSTVWVSERPGDATRLKLVINDWLLGVLVALGEALAFAEALGLDGRSFLDAIRGGPLDTPYAQLTGGAMLAHDYPASFAARHALKDAELMEDAARDTGLTLRSTRAAAELLRAAVDGGRGDDDFAVLHEEQRAR